MSGASGPERAARPIVPPALAKGLLAALLFVAVPALLTAIGGGYLYQIATTALIFIILAASLNLVTGTAGLLSLGHAGFYGIGAYAAAILSTRLGLPFLITLPAAGLVAGAIGALVALPTMRLVSIYFAVATLGIGEMIFVTLLNWTDFTRGPMGIRSIPPIDITGLGAANADAAIFGGRGGGGDLALGAVAADAFLLRQRAARRAGRRSVRERHGARRRSTEDRRFWDQLLLRRNRRRPARPHRQFHQPGPVPVRRVRSTSLPWWSLAGSAACPAP